MIKKADIILIAFLLLTGIFLWWLFSFSSSNGDSVSIFVAGKVTATYPLYEDRKIPLSEGEFVNNVVIHDGKVSMESANCPGQECVRQGAISKNGESIICLPHRVVITITAKNSSYDAIVS